VQLLFRIYQRFTWLSLDVVLGSIAGMLFFAKLRHITLDWQEYALLGMAVWCIYTADHLMDARKTNSIEDEDRHHFHLVYQKPLLALMIATGLLGLFWAIRFFGFSRELYFGAGLGIVIMLILLGVRKFAANRVRMKELSSSVFYVIGISWLPWYATPVEDYSWIAVTLTLAYVGLAYLNLIMLSSLDEEKDKRAGFTSIATKIPSEKLSTQIRNLAFVLVACCLLLLVYVNSMYRVYPLLLLIMLLLHYLSFFKSNLTPSQIRIRMELTFAVPLLLLILR
jgi:1,4-dihydroxy-2-naphthoate octaprenyltransferase